MHIASSRLRRCSTDAPVWSLAPRVRPNDHASCMFIRQPGRPVVGEERVPVTSLRPPATSRLRVQSSGITPGFIRAPGWRRRPTLSAPTGNHYMVIVQTVRRLVRRKAGGGRSTINHRTLMTWRRWKTYKGVDVLPRAQCACVNEYDNESLRTGPHAWNTAERRRNFRCNFYDCVTVT